MVGAGLVTRVAALAATLVVVRHVSQLDYGEATVAAIAVLTTNALSSLGIGQYVIIKARGRRDLTFHATTYQLALGAVTLVALWVFREPLAAWSKAPGMVRYLPPMVASMILDRLSFMPERLLMRDLRFGRVATARSASELAYAGVAAVTAILGWGGMSIMAGNVARSALRAGILMPSVDRREWLEPCALRRDTTVDLFKFSLPLAVATVAYVAAIRWDNLIVASFFGAAAMAGYNVAYNLAGMASGLIGDQLVDVLVPTFGVVEEGRRREGLIKAARLAGLVAIPLCTGLAAVAPTVVATFLSASWHDVSPMLAILSVAMVFGPLGGLIVAYLQACAMPWRSGSIPVVTMIAILGAVATIGRFGILWACVGVLGGSLLAVAVSFLLIPRTDRVPLRRLAATQIGPLLASIPMAAVVLGVRYLLFRLGVGAGALRLLAEVALGGAAYAGAAWIVARPAATELLGLVDRAFLRRGRPVSPSAAPSRPA